MENDNVHETSNLECPKKPWPIIHMVFKQKNQMDKSMYTLFLEVVTHNLQKMLLTKSYIYIYIYTHSIPMFFMTKL
jgi:hypothetical protein